jgi:hypothetical protein
MSNLVASKAYRTLRHIENYINLYTYNHPYQKGVPENFSLEDISFEENEQLIGVYENFPGKPEDSIVITDRGLYLFSETTWIPIKYKDILEVNTMGEKFLKSGVNLHLNNDTVTAIPIKGGKGRFTDKFAFLHFFNEVLRGYDNIV